MSQTTHETLDHLFRHEYGKIISQLTKIYGVASLEWIEDAVQESLIKAMQSWPYNGTPSNTTGWIFKVAKNNLIDQLRRGQKIRPDSVWDSNGEIEPADPLLGDELTDAQLRMIFTCCHPDLPVESQIILTLKLIGGFGKTEIAKALLKSEDAVAKAFTRSRNKLKDNRDKFEVPTGKDLESRLSVVLKIIYLLFNEGYKTSSAEELIRKDICLEALRLCQLLADHERTRLPAVYALLSLMCFHSSRFDARLDKEGNLLTLEEQDRSLWNRELINAGNAFLTQASEGNLLSEYHLQAGIAFNHCNADSFEQTDWHAILELYDQQMIYFPSPIIALNRLVAVLMAKGPKVTLQEIQKISDHKELKNNYLYYSIYAEIYHKLNNKTEAVNMLQQAIDLTVNATEKRHLTQKMSVYQA